MVRIQIGGMVTTHTTAIHQVLHLNAISVNLPGDSKDDVLDGMMDLLKNHPNVIDFDGVRKAVKIREELMSTGVGNGLALPHAKTSAASGLAVAFATTARPIDYGSVDHIPVRLVMMIISTENEKTQHIKLLSRISRCMNEPQTRQQLLEAKSPGEVLSIFQTVELETR